ncbi:hypothetical protein [Dyadobacter alkalitolerans]|uniref:hypothetical protein n=1 Tax=Dyadobacter alkalitolerans TaxID=492736 RepID=UPI0012F8BF8F|nr:hypothetical protein [Dyadobacter alkalitolerans]
MSTIAVIDLQPLSCMGVQAYLQNLLPASQYQTAYTKETIHDLVLGTELDLVILGLNRESPALTTFLTEKILAAGPQVPVIVLYEIFDVELLRHFGNHAVTGFIAKDNDSMEIDKCINIVLAGNSFMCQKSSQYVIAAFADNAKQPRKPTKKKVASIAY